MRVLGIETSSSRGSVALVERGRVVAEAGHEVATRHAELLLPLLDGVLSSAGWTRASLDRLAVGVGPGAFTGLRVGLALAQGIAVGLDRPVVGVGSLAALCGAVPDDVPGLRVGVVGARRGEVFVAAHARDGAEAWAPRALARSDAWAQIRALAGAGPWVAVGAAARELDPGALCGGSLDLPAASQVALLGAGLDPAAHPAEPRYVREADAVKPRLPSPPPGALS